MQRKLMREGRKGEGEARDTEDTPACTGKSNTLSLFKLERGQGGKFRNITLILNDGFKPDR